MRRIIVYVLAAIIGASVGITAFPEAWELIGQQHGFWNHQWFNGIIGAFIFLVIIFFLMNSILAGLKRLDNIVAGLNLSKSIFTVVGVILGLLLGLLISLPISMLHIPVLSNVLAALVIIALGYLGYVIFYRRGEDIARTIFRQGKRINAANDDENADVSNDTKTDKNIKLLDTSVIIDGRVFDIIKTGFLDGEIIVPNFVLLELQTLSDSNDVLKRAKGRRGLDLVNSIRDEITISDLDYKDLKEVDTKLLRYAVEQGAKLVTNDFNLNKLAEIQGVKVLNINDLANAVKQQVMVGEDLSVVIVKEGTERHQGIAYLPDGTMVVIEDTDRLIGKTVLSTVTKVLQTSAGRMIFAEVKR
ncbi:PIN/TRAM domain-containing protein [Lactovum odontotermitis]